VHTRSQWLREHTDSRRETGSNWVRAPKWNANEFRKAAGTSATYQLSSATDVLASGPAVGTFPTRDLRIHRDPLPHQLFADSASCADHGSHQLMAHDERRLTTRAPRCEASDVAAANPSRLNPHQNLIKQWRWRAELPNAQHPTLVADESMHASIINDRSFKYNVSATRHSRTWGRRDCRDETNRVLKPGRPRSKGSNSKASWSQLRRK
jgi:hypothetical protein